MRKWREERSEVLENDEIASILGTSLGPRIETTSWAAPVAREKVTNRAVETRSSVAMLGHWQRYIPRTSARHNYEVRRFQGEAK